MRVFAVFTDVILHAYHVAYSVVYHVSNNAMGNAVIMSILYVHSVRDVLLSAVHVVLKNKN